MMKNELESLVDEVKKLQTEVKPTSKTKSTFEDWDVKKSDVITYFDKRLSYEITGYRPITQTEGLDFKPSWFTEARDTKVKTGHYTSYLFGSKAYRDFWNEEYRRCRDGLSVNGYTIPGAYYYFLNYYQLPQTKVAKLGTSRKDIFPEFYTAQYEFFHYFELCKVLKKDVCLFKARG